MTTTPDLQASPSDTAAHDEFKPNRLVVPGSCTLVGAGPGDPELLTLKALKAIQQASVLFVDDLVSPDIVAFPARTPASCMSASAAAANPRRRRLLKN